MEKGFFTAKDGRKVGYLLHAPAFSGETKRPMVIYLHGADGCGDDPEQVARISSMQTYINEGALVPEEDVVVLSPQCPDGSRWDPLAPALMGLIDEMIEKYNVDPDRIALTGVSLGGMGTFTVAFQYPERFSCLVPVCACVDPEKCAVLTRMPVHIFHGTKDTGMGFSVIQANDVINKAGGNSTLTMLEGEGHEIRWIYVAPQFDIVRWMTAQRR